MPLFIDRLPFHHWTDQTQTPPLDYHSIALPVLLTDVGAPPPSGSTPQEWHLDTANTAEAFAWRHHLVRGGLDPDVQQLARGDRTGERRAKHAVAGPAG